MKTIEQIETLLYNIPLKQELFDALHGKHSHFELIVVIVTLNDGTRGTGYTYTGGRGGRSIFSLVHDELAPLLIGQDPLLHEKHWVNLLKYIHYVGRGGIDSFAVSALDIALWDIKAKLASMPLYRLLGGGQTKVAAYAGAIDLGLSLESLIKNNEHYLEQGYRAVKIKLGKPTLEEDLERVEAVRRCIGKDTVLMVDANAGWSVERAIKTEHLLRDFNVYWIEEPTSPDDIDGYARISSKTIVPIAAGENFHSISEFHTMLRLGKIDFPQPDASNIGGITGWCKVAQLVFAHNLPVSTHGMHELHVSLLASVTHAGYLEVHSFPIDTCTKHPLVLEEGYAIPPETEGHGVEFQWSNIEKFKVLNKKQHNGGKQ